MAAAAWACGDPGMQYDTTVNDWHTCANTARINASNPCSEYMHIDNSACNLASLNLMKFVDDDGVFDVEAFRRAVAVDDLGAGDHRRQLELPDGEDRAEHARDATARPRVREPRRAVDVARPSVRLRRRTRVRRSDHRVDDRTRVRDVRGDRAARRTVRRVPRKSRTDVARSCKTPRCIAYNTTQRKRRASSIVAAQKAWDDAFELGSKFGYRNAQATVLAPTGTIAFMMDCDTTGVEPDIALVKYKKLVGGGMIKIVNQTVPRALAAPRLQRRRRSTRSSHYIDEHGHHRGRARAARRTPSGVRLRVQGRRTASAPSTTWATSR